MKIERVLLVAAALAVWSMVYLSGRMGPHRRKHATPVPVHGSELAQQKQQEQQQEDSNSNSVHVKHAASVKRITGGGGGGATLTPADTSAQAPPSVETEPVPVQKLEQPAASLRDPAGKPAPRQQPLPGGGAACAWFGDSKGDRRN